MPTAPLNHVYRFRPDGDADLAWLGKRGVATRPLIAMRPRDMTAKKQRALLTSKGGLPAVPTIRALVSVAEAHQALNEGDCVEPSVSEAQLSSQGKGKEQQR